MAVPQHVARVLTFPDRVTPHNIERLRQAILNGSPPCCGACTTSSPNTSILTWDHTLSKHACLWAFTFPVKSADVPR